jgi:CubicO group peptidase (beta-lactamase class C family)
VISRAPSGRAVAILVALALLLVGLVRPPPAVVAASPLDEVAIDDHVRAMIDRWAVPGAAIGIVRDGAVVHVAAFGEAAAGRAMTTDTPVVIGSVGKSITALAVRQLIEAGRLDIDAPVTRYLPWFTLAGPAATADRITIGDLVRHTSGLSTADGQDLRWYETGLTPEDVARGLSYVRPDRSGRTYEYSNLNYVLLGVVIEVVSGQPYGDYVQDHIFDPLAMGRSYTDLETAQAASGVATGHRYLFGMPVAFDEPYPSGMVPAGYQISSAQDMAQFVAALSNGGVYGGTDVVVPGRSGAADVAFGTDWQPLGTIGPGVASGQSGASLVTNADILVMPAEHLGVVVLLNANPIQLTIPGGAAAMALDIMSLALGGMAATSAPGVRQVYLVVDAILLVLVGLLVVHAVRARTWAARLAASRHRGLFLGRTVLADLILPLAVLIGLPLAIGSTGSSPPGDVIAGWRFVLWTLPDLAIALLVLATVPLILGGLKLGGVWTRSRRAVGSTRRAVLDVRPGRS